MVSQEPGEQHEPVDDVVSEEQVQSGAAESPDVSEGAPAPAPPSEVELLQAQLAETQARLRKVSKAFTEQKEEMQAFRQRIEAQASSARARREVEVVKVFFEPVQSLQRSLEGAEGVPEAFLAGLQMVHRQFLDGLTRLGLERIPGVGAPFDPNLHEALALAPVPDPAQDGTVLMVHIDGYHVKGRVIQASQVVVGKHTPVESAPEPEPETVADPDADRSDDLGTEDASEEA